MSLVRLLTSAKALMTLRDLPTAYRLRREARLPKFGNGRNPFAAKESAVPAPTRPSPVTDPTGPTTVASSAPEARLATARKTLWPWKTPAPGKSGPPLKTATDEGPHRAAGATRTPVQGELTLDTVKVVRNDLHGSDVDWSPRAPAASRPYQQVASHLISGANAAERALDRLAERLGAGTP